MDQKNQENIIGSISKKQLIDIAEKMQDLNAHDLDEAAKIIAGSARSMGIEERLMPSKRYKYLKIQKN